MICITCDGMGQVRGCPECGVIWCPECGGKGTPRGCSRCGRTKKEYLFIRSCVRERKKMNRLAREQYKAGINSGCASWDENLRRDV